LASSDKAGDLVVGAADGGEGTVPVIDEEGEEGTLDDFSDARM